MEKKRKVERPDELREEYDLTALLKGAVRGKYAERYGAGTNLVLLDPEVSKAFPSTEAVNEAPKLVMQVQRVPTRKPGRKAG
jgi:hypothetical protein